MTVEQSMSLKVGDGVWFATPSAMPQFGKVIDAPGYEILIDFKGRNVRVNYSTSRRCFHTEAEAWDWFIDRHKALNDETLLDIAKEWRVKYEGKEQVCDSSESGNQG